MENHQIQKMYLDPQVVPMVGWTLQIKMKARLQNNYAFRWDLPRQLVQEDVQPQAVWSFLLAIRTVVPFAPTQQPTRNATNFIRVIR